MKKFVLLLTMAMILTSFAAAQDEQSDMSEYFSDPDKVDNIWFTVFLQYTFSADKELSKDEADLLINALGVGFGYVSEMAEPDDSLCVTFMFNNNTAKAFFCTFDDYRLYTEGSLDATTFFQERVSVEDLEL